MGEVPLQFSASWRKLGSSAYHAFLFVEAWCRANTAHIRQSRQDSGLVFQVKVPKTFQVVPSSLGSGVPNTLEQSKEITEEVTR